ncbi:MAG TPA: glycosyltransferase family 1 protein [Deltaproteobacteria bacterium]|nr:glycosyltransferase family 1 protein [Deltaproteobacteria bacterium]
MEPPLRIAYVAYRGNMNSGGQGIYLWFLAREMARRGHRVHVFVGPPHPDPMPFAEVETLPNQQFWAKWVLGQTDEIIPRQRPLEVLRPLNFYELAASRLGFLPEPFAFSVRAFQRLTRRHRAGDRYDLVHDVQCLGYGLLGLRALGLPVVTTVHHPLTVDRRASFVRDESFRDAVGTAKFYPIGMQAFVARRLDRVLTSSETSACQIVRDFGVRPERIRNVRNGLDTELFSPDPRIGKDPKGLLCVGRSTDPNKGIATLIQALARLPRDVRLTLVDDDSPDNQVRAWAREAGVLDRLRLTGRVGTTRLVDLYRRATLVVVPSRYEGFGLPAVEAMACGTPVVATRAGALPEVIQLTGGGILAERDDPDSIARAVSRLLGDPERRASMASRGRERTVAELGWPRVAARTAEVYAEVVAESRRGRPTTTITSAKVGH